MAQKGEQFSPNNGPEYQSGKASIDPVVGAAIIYWQAHPDEARQPLVVEVVSPRLELTEDRQRVLLAALLPENLAKIPEEKREAKKAQIMRVIAMASGQSRNDLSVDVRNFDADALRAQVAEADIRPHEKVNDKIKDEKVAIEASAIAAGMEAQQVLERPNASPDEVAQAILAVQESLSTSISLRLRIQLMNLHRGLRVHYDELRAQEAQKITQEKVIALPSRRQDVPHQPVMVGSAAA